MVGLPGVTGLDGLEFSYVLGADEGRLASEATGRCEELALVAAGRFSAEPRGRLSQPLQQGAEAAPTGVRSRRSGWESRPRCGR